MSVPPARIGEHVQDVETPALLLDLPTLERNLQLLEEICSGTNARPRPHAKSHKCPNLARLQVDRGAVGVCCQKVSEAVVLVDAGLSDVLVSNQVVDPVKLRRLAALARRARIGVCVDDAANVAQLSSAAEGAAVELDVLVEIEVGMLRCGVAPGPAAAELAAVVDGSPGLRFAHVIGVTESAGSVHSRFDSVIIDGTTQSAEGLKRGSRGTWDVKQVEDVRSR